MMNREQLMEILKRDPETKFVMVNAGGDKMDARFCKEYGVILCCHTSGTKFAGYELVSDDTDSAAQNEQGGAL